jgi:ABC-2 type transport system ATP-binding protein
MNSIIATHQLSKTYNLRARQIVALTDLNIEVQKGEIFGYLGPNGAGKTTTIRLLLDLIRPSHGKAEVFGLDVRQHAVDIHQRIGYLPGELNLWPNQNARRVVRHFGELRGGVDWRFVDQLTERLKLDLSMKFRSYSTGNKRKLGLVLALMHQPELLILDEPTSGLDPLMQQEFNQIMREWRDAGRTVFLSSHMLSEVQAICDRVAILKDGKLKTVQTMQEFMRREFRLVSITFRDTPRTEPLAAVSGVQNIRVEGHQVHLRMAGDVDPLLKALHDQYIIDFDAEDASLEDVFLAYYSNNHATMPVKERA